MDEGVFEWVGVALEVGDLLGEADLEEEEDLVWDLD